MELPYLSDYKVNPALDKLVTELGGVKNFNNNALNSFVAALLFQDAVEKATANGGTLDRQTLFTALTTTRLVQRRGIVGPTNIGARASSDCSVLVQLQNGVWNRVDPTKPGTFDCSPANLATLKMNTVS